ncbi:MAG TPA: hypothetical protein VIZ68_03345, partial [Thermoplasmata archaeon]
MGIVWFFFLSTALTLAVALVLSVAPNYPQSSTASAFVALSLPGTLFWGAVLFVKLRSRGRTAFALTNLRVLSVAGFWSSEFRFATWGQVQRLYVPAGDPSTLIFEARGGGP